MTPSQTKEYLLNLLNYLHSEAIVSIEQEVFTNISNAIFEQPSEEEIDSIAEQEYPDGCDGTERSATLYRRIFKHGIKFLWK